MPRHTCHIRVFAVSPVDTLPVDTFELVLLELLFPPELLLFPPGIVGMTDEAGVVLAVTVVVGVIDVVGVSDTFGVSDTVGVAVGVVVTVGVIPGVFEIVGVGVLVIEGCSGSSTEKTGILSLLFEFLRKVALTFS